MDLDEVDEVKIRDRAFEDYEEIRYTKQYSVRYQESWFRLMLSLIGRDGLILDNGCGTGKLIELLHKNEVIVIGIDISKGMLSKAKKRMNLLVNADSKELPFKEETFDTIVCKSLLHHLSDPRKAISEMHRVLKKGGEIVIAETNQSLLSNIPRIFLKKHEHFPNTHKNFRKEELINIIEGKFYVEKVKHFGYIAYPLLGFPDIFDIFEYFPVKKQLASFLISIDQLISMIPLIHMQSWGIIVKASKREECGYKKDSE